MGDAATRAASYEKGPSMEAASCDATVQHTRLPRPTVQRAVVSGKENINCILSKNILYNKTQFFYKLLILGLIYMFRLYIALLKNKKLCITVTSCHCIMT